MVQSGYRRIVIYNPQVTDLGPEVKNASLFNILDNVLYYASLCDRLATQKTFDDDEKNDSKEAQYAI